MDDIFKMALVFVYPDGFVDYAPIQKQRYSHVDYFYEYLKHSPRFQKIVKDNHFLFDWQHNSNSSPICKLLAQNEIIVFYNTAIYDVLYNMEEAELLAYFAISFPNDYEELSSIPIVKEIVKKLNDQQFEMEKFRTDLDDFAPFEMEEYNKFLENKKDNEEEKKL